MIALAANTKVYLAVEPTDMRKGVDGLALLVTSHLNQDPFSGHLFVFSNRKRNTIKLLLWDRNGFWVFHKRLERQRFRWPIQGAGIPLWSMRELNWLLDGLDPVRLKGHRQLDYSTII